MPAGRRRKNTRALQCVLFAQNIDLAAGDAAAMPGGQSAQNGKTTSPSTLPEEAMVVLPRMDYVAVDGAFNPHVAKDNHHIALDDLIFLHHHVAGNPDNGADVAVGSQHRGKGRDRQHQDQNKGENVSSLHLQSFTHKTQAGAKSLPPGHKKRRQPLF